MGDDAREQADRGSRQTNEAALSARLRRLGERLDASAARRTPEVDSAGRATVDTSAFARGFRLSTEFVAGVLAGAGLGWLVDHWLRTSPWGLIVFTMFGFAAGVLSLIRAAGSGPGNQPSSRADSRRD